MNTADIGSRRATSSFSVLGGAGGRRTFQEHT